jgi:hypothetical protein
VVTAHWPCCRYPETVMWVIDEKSRSLINIWFARSATNHSSLLQLVRATESLAIGVNLRRSPSSVP